MDYGGSKKIRTSINWDFGKAKQSEETKIGQTFTEGGIYRFHIKSPNKTSDLVNLGIPSVFVESIGDGGHYFLVIKNNNNNKFQYFQLSSRFFHFMFNKEIGCIKDFYSNSCDAVHQSKLKKNHKELYNIIDKYHESENGIDYDTVFLLHKQQYSLPMETFIKIKKVTSIDSTFLQECIKQNLIGFRFHNIIRERDFKLLINKISINIEEAEKEGFQSIDNEELKDLINLFA